MSAPMVVPCILDVLPIDKCIFSPFAVLAVTNANIVLSFPNIACNIGANHCTGFEQTKNAYYQGPIGLDLSIRKHSSQINVGITFLIFLSLPRPLFLISETWK